VRRQAKYRRTNAVLVLAAVVSLAVVAGPLVPASPLLAAVTSVRVVLSSNVIGSQSDYAITFWIDATLATTADSITVRFPYGTAVPATGVWNPGDVTVEGMAEFSAGNPETSIAVGDITSTGPVAATRTGPTVTIALTSLADDISRVAVVRLRFRNNRITNPPTTGYHSLSVNTSVETRPEEASPYVLTEPQAVPPDPADLPDLVVTEKHEELAVGARVCNVWYTVENIGNTVALAGCDTELWIDGTWVQQREVPVALEPGESYDGLLWAVLADFDSIDPEIRVCVDANAEVAESIEDNNCLASTWPELRPDLEVVSVSPQWVAGSEGTTYTVAFEVKNTGLVSAPGGHDVVVTVDGTAIEEEVEVPQALARGGTFIGGFTTEVQLSGTTDEVHVCADVNDEVPELDEGDNCLAGHREAEVHVHVELAEGWNVVSLAAEPYAGYTASTLAADINRQGGSVTEVFRWNALGGSWDTYLVESDYGRDFPIDVGYGYLLRNATAITWSYAGTPLTARFAATYPKFTRNLSVSGRLLRDSGSEGVKA